MDYKVVENLVKLINDSSLREFELQEDGFRIYMSKNQMKEPSVLEKGIEINPHNEPLKVNEINKTEPVKENCYIVKSPMVGTFYTSPSEDKEAFVKVGNRVKKNSVLCIIEAMKLMNELESEVEGTVEEIFVNNGEMVEYGQPIMSIKF